MFIVFWPCYPCHHFLIKRGVLKNYAFPKRASIFERLQSIAKFNNKIRKHEGSASWAWLVSRTPRLFFRAISSSVFRPFWLLGRQGATGWRSCREGLKMLEALLVIPWLVRGWFAHAIDSVAGFENAIESWPRRSSFADSARK